MEGQLGGDSNAASRLRAALERAQIESICECARDIKERWYRTVKRVEGEEARRKSRVGWFEQDLPELCLLLERALPPRVEETASAQLFSVGAGLSLAGVCVYHLLATPVSLASGATATFFDGESGRVRAAFETSCLRLASIVAHVGALPSAWAWEERRPDTFS